MLLSLHSASRFTGRAGGLLAALLLAAHAGHAQAPANDDCVGAVPVPVAALGNACAFFTASNANATATASVADPSCAYDYQGGDVWYSFAVPASGAVQVTSSAAPGSSVDDTQLTLYSGSCGALVEVGCNDDISFDNYFSQISLGGRTPGEVLYLRAATYANLTAGDFGLCVRELAPCGAPTGVAVGGVSPMRATVSYAPNVLAGSYLITYTPAGGATQTETTTDASFELHGLLPGTTYTVTVASDCGSSQPASAPVTFTTSPPPANDDCAGAVALPVAVACTPLVASSEGASATAGLPDPPCGNYYGNDLWYTVTVPASGVLLLETGEVDGSSVYDTGLAVYTGSCAGLTLLACDDNNSGVAFSYLRLTGLTPGAVLLVRVWVAYGGSGTFTLCATTDDALPTTTWTGTSSSDWFDAANWTAGVPTAATNATVPGAPNAPSLTDASRTAEAHTLSIDKYAGFSFGAGTLAVSGNLRCRNPFARFYDSSNIPYTGGVVELRGTGPQQVSGLSEVYDLRLHGTGAATLTTSLRLYHALTMDGGVLDTGPAYVELYNDNPFAGEFLSNARLVHESESSYVRGRLLTRRFVDQNVREDCSGLGLTLFTTASTTPGGILVNRVTGTPPAGVDGGPGIGRVYYVRAWQETGLDLSMDLHYFAHELNGLADATLRPYSSPVAGADGGRPGRATGPWTPEAGQRLPPAAPDSASTVHLAGLTHLSAWTLGSATAPLPVVLAAFTAEASGPDALLRWTTASELHNAYFEAEASPDGRSFAPVGRVAGRGTTQQPGAYSLRDQDAARHGTPVVYYHLRQVDTDGRASYSPVRPVVLASPAAAGPTAYPNPFTGTLTVRLPGPATTPVLLVLRDALGREVARHLAPAGPPEVPLPGLAHLPAGLYLLAVTTGEKTVQLKVMSSKQ